MLVLIWTCLFSIGARANQYDPSLFNDVGEYTYMWWADGFRHNSETFNIQTSGYGLSFDYNDFDIVTFAPIANALAEAETLTQDNSLINSLPSANLRCVIESSSVQYSATSTGSDRAKCMLVESGKYFQRRWLEDITLESGAPAGQMCLEIAAWPDRISFVVYFTPDATLSDGSLLIEMDLDDVYSNVLQSGVVKGLSDTQGQSGFIFTSDYSAAQLTCDGPTATCSLRFDTGSWPAGEERSVALIVYPESSDSVSKIDKVAQVESSFMTVNAQQTEPTAVSLTSSYDKRYGWYNVGLRNDSCGTYQQSGNNRIERVDFSVTNPDTQPRQMRLSFYKDGNVCQVVGISAMLCDDQYNPLGIPIQLSKNWHNGTISSRFDQTTWFHGTTMITVPAQATINLNYTSVGAHWGGVAAASHAQLCLIGWGDYADWGNQLWDESALGSWGESITYDPDVNLNRSMVDDVRPVMVHNLNRNTPGEWSWTNNVGGADFLCYWDANGTRQYNSRMKTYYKRYCPVLTEVTYAGQGAGGAIEMQCVTQLYRTDDIVRGVYKLRYDVTNTVAVDASPAGNNKRIAFFQLGADGYNDHNFEKMARGNSNGLVEEWSPVKGGDSYSRIAMPCTGSLPWFSLHEANPKDTSLYGAWANRGLVIRSYKARMGGVDDDTPYASVYGTTNGGYNSANVELSVPDTISQLLPGDYVEAEIVYVIMPQFDEDYYGPNANLASALSSMEDTWQMIYREATGNDLEINMIGGTLLKSYPLHIKACSGAEFEITGGLGYIPMTFENLCDYEGYTLEEYQNESWVPVDQAYHGNDFWQVDFDSVTETWSRTYTVNLDSPSDTRVTRHFRLTGSCMFNSIADLNCDGEVDLLDLKILSSEWLCQVQSIPVYQDSCVTWWKFDEDTGTFAGDSSDFNNYGTITGASWVPGKINSALDFEGADNVAMTIDDLSSITDQVSIACWIYGDSVQPQADHLVVGDNSRGNVFKIHLPWSDGVVYWDAGNDSLGSTDRISKSASSNEYKGQWNHWVFTKNATSGDQKIYLNGLPWQSGTGKTKMMDGISDFRIGLNDYDGMIDDFRIYNTELNSGEVSSIFTGDILGGCDYATSDLNDDSKVNLSDFQILAAEWLTVP